MPKKSFDVPVLMYHSVGVPDKEWNWNYLTCPFDRFEGQLKAIKQLGYTTISLNQLYGYMVQGKTIPKKSIALTFDDGYADNWIFAYPLLKKYGMCGTVFINPDFVDKRDIKRKQYSENTDVSTLETTGFLSWEEIIQMDRDGIIFAESHALTHTWYPVSDKLIDFRHPGDDYIWMTWNEHPDLKYKLQKDDPDLVELGSPVYENGKSLMSPRYFPDFELKHYLSSLVSNNGGADFFKSQNWRENLITAYQKYNNTHSTKGDFENQESFIERIRFELKYTKELLEKKLQREITFLCWPGGSATETGMCIAKALGYRFFNAARDMSAIERKGIKNIRFGGDRVTRFTPFTFWDGQENRDSKVIYMGNFRMYLRLIRYSEKYFSKYWYKLLLILSEKYYGLK